ncbi:MAG: hypothetical protein JNJ86_09445, partial [Chitinophagaceae bacterium]|nr:hypothetical protein [Chitinophagaceae bacterium]
YKSSTNKEGINTVVVNISAKDKNGYFMPVADNEISFSVAGPAKIIGVGNGNPVSLEKDRFIEVISIAGIQLRKEKYVEVGEDYAGAMAMGYDDKQWNDAFREDRDEQFGKRVKQVLYRGDFFMPDMTSASTITFFSKNIGSSQSVYINGVRIADSLTGDKDIVLDLKILHPGKNAIAIVAAPLLKKYPWDFINTNPGNIQVSIPAEGWKRKLFNGLTQVIIQTGNSAGEIKLTASAGGLPSTSVIIQ